MNIKKFLKNNKTPKSLVVPESEIENSFVKEVRKSACKAWKLTMLSRRGFPDRTVLCPGGHIFFIEFKRKGGKLSINQSKIIDMLDDLGFDVYVCDEIGQAEKILNDKITNHFK